MWGEQFEQSISEVATATAVYLTQGVSVQARSSDDASPLVLGGAPPDPIWRFLAMLRPTRAGSPPKTGKSRAA